MPELIKKGGLKKVLFRRSSCYHASLASMWSLRQEMSTKLQHGQPVKPPPLRQRPSVKNQAKALARDSQQPHADRVRAAKPCLMLLRCTITNGLKGWGQRYVKPLWNSKHVKMKVCLLSSGNQHFFFFSLSESEIITNKHTFSSFRVAVQMPVALKTLWGKSYERVLNAL